MLINKAQAVSILSLKTRREDIGVALMTVSLPSTVLKNSLEASLENNQAVYC